MLTVKVVHRGHRQSVAIASSQPASSEQTMEPFTTDEVVFEASQVHMVRDGRMVSFEFDGGPGVQEIRGASAGQQDPVGHVYCDTETGQIVYEIKAVASPETDIIMFVMNRFGATVAKYYL